MTGARAERGKTSIYIDRELWAKFKVYAARQGKEVSRILEEMIREELVEEELADIVAEEVSKIEDYEIDFEPVEPKGASVSELIRVMRDERGNLS